MVEITASTSDRAAARAGGSGCLDAAGCLDPAGCLDAAGGVGVTGGVGGRREPGWVPPPDWFDESLFAEPSAYECELAEEREALIST